MPLHKYMIEHLLYPAMEQHKGNQIRAILNELQLSQKANAPAVQYQRLIKLLLHCKQHVPAYAGLLPDDSVILTDPMAVLRTRIPLLPKTNFQQNPEAYLADDIPTSARIANCTGGSTGQPVHFYMTRHQVESYEAARWRGLSWYGITQGSRSVMLWGSPIELSKQAQLKNRLKESLLKNRRILSAYNLTEQDLTKHVRFLEHYRPEYLYGYATILTAFAQMLENAHITPNLSLKAVVSTSETLEKWQENRGMLTFSEREEAQGYLEWIIRATAAKRELYPITVVKAEEVVLEEVAGLIEKQQKKEALPLLAGQAKASWVEALDEQMRYVYPYEQNGVYKNKYSVSEIKHQQMEKAFADDFSERPDFLQEKAEPIVPSFITKTE